MNMVKRVAIGCDPNAAELKNVLIAQRHRSGSGFNECTGADAEEHQSACIQQRKNRIQQGQGDS